MPIRFMSYLGFVVGIVGFLYAAFVVGNFVRGNPIEGWSSLMIVVLIVGGPHLRGRLRAPHLRDFPARHVPWARDRLVPCTAAPAA